MQHLHVGLHGQFQNWHFGGCVAKSNKATGKLKEREGQRHTDFYRTTPPLNLYNVWIHTLPFGTVTCKSKTDKKCCQHFKV